MARPVSSTFKQAVFSQQTSQVFLILLEIDEDNLASPIRVVNNYENITHNGNTYVGFPFIVNLPNDVEDQIPEVSLTISNVDRQIVEAVRNATGPPSISLKIVLASDPNTVEAGPINLTLRNATYDAMHVTGIISSDDILNEPFPGDLFTPENFPGLF